MYELFSMVPEACANTAKIAEQCNFDFDFGHTKIPYYEAPGGMDNQAYFEKLCWEALPAGTAPTSPEANKSGCGTRSGSSRRWGTPITT